MIPKTILPLLSLLFLIFLSNCSKKHRDDVINNYNKFLYENKIDSSKYNTFEELAKKNRAQKIILIEGTDPLINMEAKTVILKVEDVKKQKYFQKFDYQGNLLDSLKIKEDYTLFQDFILDKDYYISWFYNNDKSKKKIEDLHINPEDTISQKKIITKILKNNLIYDLESKEVERKSSNDSIKRTYVYVLYIENEKVFKANIGSENNDFHGLKYYGNESTTNLIFREFKNIERKKYLTFDNYYAKKRIFHPSNCFALSVNGCPPDATYYTGTAFLSSEKYGLKIKYHTEADVGRVDSTEAYFYIYSDSLLDFLLISEDETNREYYVIKK